MTTTEKILSAIVLVAIFYSCGKRQCKQDDTISGIILQPLDLSFGGNEGSVGQGQYVVQNDSIYHLCFQGSGDTPPAIDFALFTVLGYSSNGSCNTSLNRDVQPDSVTKTYHYTLTVYDCGCFTKVNYIFFNWVLVPKLQPGWTVTFEERTD